ncbi:MAG: hypothetical protein L0Y73_09655 [Candidatus Aminicenantes bacterium]|nr:hypothetical protein [Candidatus Aminicenantes bacterium]
MNILDEQILENQRQLLKSWRIPIRQIGYDIGRKGLKDKEIISLLIGLRRPTFFTLDFDFFESRLCHQKYAIVCMDVGKNEAALYIRRLLHHPEFDTAAKRMGKVIRLSSMRIGVWKLHKDKEVFIDWNPS